MATDVLALVNYYCRAGYYRHAQTVCNEMLKKRSNDPQMLLWRAFSMLKEGQASEAVRERETLARKADMQTALPVKIALLHAHRACKIVDEDAVGRLESDTKCAKGAAQLWWID